jgi:hypothetical protein
METHTSYQRHSFHKTDVNGIKSYLMLDETRIDMYLLRSSRMARCKRNSETIPGTS